MVNQEIVIYLNTPLIQMEIQSKVIQKIRAKIVSEDAGGYVVSVKAVADGKKWNDDTQGLKKIFIPYHKIDFISLE